MDPVVRTLRPPGKKRSITLIEKWLPLRDSHFFFFLPRLIGSGFCMHFELSDYQIVKGTLKAIGVF